MNNDLISKKDFLDLFYVASAGQDKAFIEAVEMVVADTPAVDAVEVVRCQNCIHAEPFERNCELNSTAYMHCKIWRGEETKNVWHKYKKYYRDYSVVDRDGYCDEGEPLDGERKGDDD